MTFIEKSDLEEYSNFDLTEEGAELADSFAAALQAEAERTVGYEFTKHVHTTYFDGGQHRVWLPVPAKAIDFTEPIEVSVYSDTTSLYEPLIQGPAPRLLRDGSIDLHGPGYGPDAVAVSYAVGWNSDSFPKDLKQALVELLAGKWSVANAASTAAKTGTDDSAAVIESISIGSLRKEFLVTDAAGSAATVAKALQPQVDSALSLIRSYRRMGAY